MKKEFVVKRWILIIFFFLLILSIIFVIRPGIVGYATYQDLEESNYTLEEFGQNVRDLQLDLVTTKTNLSLYAGFTEQLMNQFSGISEELTSCLKEKTSLRSDLASNEQKIETLKEKIAEQDSEEGEDLIACKSDLSNKESELTESVQELSTKEGELNVLQEDLDLFISNLARSVCCKEKVDNPNITFYAVFNHKLVCLEEGEIELVC